MAAGTADGADTAASLAVEAAARLRREILTCQLRPGAAINARDLAPQYGISRTPMNEALKMLIPEGLVELLPRVGYAVTAVTQSDVLEVFELRLALEPMALEVGMRRAPDRELQGFARRVFPGSARARPWAGPTPAMSRDPLVLSRMADMHDHFHLAAAALSGNRRLVEMIRGLLNASRRMYAMQVPPVNPRPRTARFHERIAAAIVAGDRAQAVELMREHNRQAQQDVLAIIASALVMVGDNVPTGASGPDVVAQR